MNENPAEEFQKKVSALLVRNRNLLDILTKCHTSCGKLCRSTVKSATGCGCVTINALKTSPDFLELSKMTDRSLYGINGTLCLDCRNTIETEIGETLFYIASLCNALEISMPDIMSKEIKRIESLGKYSLH